MKKFLKYFTILTISLLSFTACEEDKIVNDGSGQGLFGLVSVAEKINLPENEGVYKYKVLFEVSNLSTTDRTISYNVISNTATSSQLTFGEAVVPANQHQGYIELIFDTDDFIMGDFEFATVEFLPVANTAINKDKNVLNFSFGIPCMVADMEGFYEGDTYWNEISYHDVIIDEVAKTFTIKEFFVDNGTDLVLIYDEAAGTVKMKGDVETGYVHPSYGMMKAVASTTVAGSFDPCTKVIKPAIKYYVSAGYFYDGPETFTYID